MEARPGDRINIAPNEKLVKDRINIKEEPIPFSELPEEVRRYLTEKGRQKEKVSTLQKLEGKHVMSILLYVDSMSPVNKSDLYSNVSRCSTMNDKLDILVDLDLIKSFRTGYTNSTILIVTGKGRRIADIIRHMVRIIEDEDVPQRYGWESETLGGGGSGKNLRSPSRNG